MPVRNPAFSRQVVWAGCECGLLLCTVWAVAALCTGDFALSPLTLPGVFAKIVVLVGVCQASLFGCDLYDFDHLGSGRVLALRLLQGLGVAYLALALLDWIWPVLRFGGGITELSVAAIFGTALAWRLWLRRERRRPGPRILLVGGGPDAQALVRHWETSGAAAFELLGAVTASATETVPAPLARLGEVGDLPRLVAAHRAHRVVVGLGERRGTLPVGALVALRAGGIAIEEAAALYEKLTGMLPAERLRPSELIFAAGAGWQRHAKRAADLIGASLLLALTGPLWACCALWSLGRRPILTQTACLGQGGRSFALLGFRNVGPVARALRLDCLPRLWNVARGEMSLVGPRPRPAADTPASHGQQLRLSVPPGLTGWARIGARGPGGATGELDRDLFYVKYHSLGLDLWILLATAKMLCLGRGSEAVAGRV